MKEKEIYIWACDLDKFRGEGILANEFIKDLRKHTSKKLLIESLQKIIIKKLISLFIEITLRHSLE